MTAAPSGAVVWTGLSADPIPVADAHAFLLDERAGGVCVFVGTTRRWTAGEETVALDYEAHDALARSELARLARDASARWPVVRCVLLHRTGRVGLAEPSVVVGVATPHRADAFEACRWLIDTLKVDVPVWKRDERPDGATRWVDPQS